MTQLDNSDLDSKKFSLQWRAIENNRGKHGKKIAHNYSKQTQYKQINKQTVPQYIGGKCPYRFKGQPYSVFYLMEEQMKTFTKNLKTMHTCNHVIYTCDNDEQ